MKRLPKPLSYLLRACVTLAAMLLAFSHVSLSEVTPLLASIALPWLLLALLCTHLGQIMSALRTRYYLACQRIDLAVMPSLQLHYVGGLFNVFLPGGAGGDVYKAWWLKQHRQGGLFNMVRLMIATRLNGLWVLGVMLCVLAWLSAPIRGIVPYAPAAFYGIAMLGTIGYVMLARILLHESLTQQLRAGLYSLGVQLMLVAAACSLCAGLGLGEHALEYVTLFMLSSMLAMLPISIGGIGVRELALLKSSAWLGLSEHAGVTLAFSFTLIALTIPLLGALVHHFYPPPKEA